MFSFCLVQDEAEIIFLIYLPHCYTHGKNLAAREGRISWVFGKSEYSGLLLMELAVELLLMLLYLCLLLLGVGEVEALWWTSLLAWLLFGQLKNKKLFIFRDTWFVLKDNFWQSRVSNGANFNNDYIFDINWSLRLTVSLMKFA